MANLVCDVRLTESPLVFLPEAAREETGAILEFRGVVRRTEDGAPLSGIRYEAHRSMAEHQLALLAAEAAQSFGLSEVVIHHRIGFARVGEASLLVRIGSRHRAEALAAMEWLVAELKQRVPIWKHPVFTASATPAAGPLASEAVVSHV